MVNIVGPNPGMTIVWKAIVRKYIRLLIVDERSITSAPFLGRKKKVRTTWKGRWNHLELFVMPHIVVPRYRKQDHMGGRIGDRTSDVENGEGWWAHQPNSARHVPPAVWESPHRH